MSKPTLRSHALGAALLLLYFVGLEWLWGWRDLLAPLQALSLAGIFLTLLAIGSSYIVRAWRIYDYFQAQMTGRFLLCGKLMLYHNFFNNLLPARSGELSFPLLLGRYFGVPFERAIVALLWFRLLDLHTVLSLGGITWLVWSEPRLWQLGLGIPWLILPLLAWRLLRWLRGHSVRFVTDRWEKRIDECVRGLPENIHELWRSWLLTWANWVIKLGVLAWLFQQFQPMPSTTAMLAAVAGELTAVLPIHAPGGFGTYEAGAAMTLMVHGYSGDAVIAAAVNVHLLLFTAALLSALLARVLPIPQQSA